MLWLQCARLKGTR
jgi:hypothetical protein